jgi:hypothetical protein
MDHECRFSGDHGIGYHDSSEAEQEGEILHDERTKLCRTRPERQ